MTRKEELEAQGYKTYENEDIQVFWKPRICQHAGECEFEASGDRRVIMHTGVREAYEGKGIARLMTGKEEFQDMMWFFC